MKITNDFTLGLPPQEAYELLLQVDKVAPCMPGAELGAVNEQGDHELGVTVKLGPMKFRYSGVVNIAEKNDAERRAVLHGEARETRGQGTAEADITMVVTAHEEGSLVSTTADMKLTGRAAQSGRGIVEDVSRRMIAQMADQISARYVTAPELAAPAEANGQPPAARAEGPPPEPAPIKATALVVTVLKGRLRALIAWLGKRLTRSR